jgi:hypothetical protein
VKNNSVVIKQEALYPWEGAVKVSIDPEKKDEFAIYVRIPGWAQNQPLPSDLYHYLDRSEERVAIKVNGKAAAFVLDKGFARIRRTWKKGDVIDLDLPMPIRRVLCQEKVTDNTGKVALERGPIVYCLEWADNGGRILDLLLPDKTELISEYRKNLLGGVTVIKGKAARLPEQEHGKSVSRESVEFTAIPYYAWAHRGQGEMAVWILRQKAKDQPASL